MPTKPNPSKIARQLRELADELDKYHELEPRRPSQEVWNVLTYAMLYESSDRENRESMGWRLIKAVRDYKESEVILEGGSATNS